MRGAGPCTDWRAARLSALVSSKSSHIQTQMGGSHVINHPHLAFMGIYFMGRASSIWGDLYGVLDCNLHLGWVNTYDTQIWRMNIRLDPLFGWNWQFFTHLEARRYTETFPWQLPPFFAVTAGNAQLVSVPAAIGWHEGRRISNLATDFLKKMDHKDVRVYV